MTNTRISWSYRDGDNYKVAADVVLAGSLPATLRQDILAHCNSETGGEPSFIPGQVGLRDLQDSFAEPSRWEDDRDHPWHEMDAIEDVEIPVDTDPDAPKITAAEFAEAFLVVKWDAAYLPPFHSEMVARKNSDPTPDF